MTFDFDAWHVDKFRDKEDAYRLAKTVSEEGYSAVIMHYDESI